MYCHCLKHSTLSNTSKILRHSDFFFNMDISTRIPGRAIAPPLPFGSAPGRKVNIVSEQENSISEERLNVVSELENDIAKGNTINKDSDRNKKIWKDKTILYQKLQTKQRKLNRV